MNIPYIVYILVIILLASVVVKVLKKIVHIVLVAIVALVLILFGRQFLGDSTEPFLDLSMNVNFSGQTLNNCSTPLNYSNNKNMGRYK